MNNNDIHYLCRMSTYYCITALPQLNSVCEKETHPDWDAKALHTSWSWRATIRVSFSIDLFTSANSALALFSEHIYLRSNCEHHGMWMAVLLMFAVHFIRAWKYSRTNFEERKTLWTGCEPTDIQHGSIWLMCSLKWLFRWLVESFI